MAETELRVILKAKDLAEHTLRITSNCNRYPKKYRFSLVDKMQNKSLEIYEYLYEANRTDLKLYRQERSELQTSAITNCDELLFYIELWKNHALHGNCINLCYSMDAYVRELLEREKKL